MTLLAAGFMFVMFIPHFLKMRKNDTLLKGDPFLIIFILGLTFLALTPSHIQNRLWIASFLWALVTFVTIKLYVWPTFKGAKEAERSPSDRKLEVEIQSAVIFLFIVFVFTSIVFDFRDTLL